MHELRSIRAGPRFLSVGFIISCSFCFRSFRALLWMGVKLERLILWFFMVILLFKSFRCSDLLQMVYLGILADRVGGTPTRTVHLADCMWDMSARTVDLGDRSHASFNRTD